jgi:Tfp pilus assembly protein FimV
LNSPHTAKRAMPLAEALAELRVSYRKLEAPASLETASLAQMRAALERAHTEVKPVATPRRSLIAVWWNAITAKRWTSALAGSLATIALATITAPMWLQYARESVEVATPFMLVSQPQTAQLDVSQMLRVNVTREAMLDFGIPVPPQRLQEQVKAEMLMGQRGELLAVRFIEPKPDTRWRWQVY